MASIGLALAILSLIFQVFGINPRFWIPKYGVKMRAAKPIVVQHDPDKLIDTVDVSVLVINYGQEPLLQKDIREPITLTFDGTTEIVSVHSVAEPQTGFNIQSPLRKDDDQSIGKCMIKVDWNSLEPGEKGRIDVEYRMHTGGKCTIMPLGRVTGQKEIPLTQ